MCNLDDGMWLEKKRDKMSQSQRPGYGVMISLVKEK
jgi:hypothetical protein